MTSKSQKLSILTLYLFMIGFSLPSLAFAANNLTIQIENVRNSKGKLICALYNSAPDFKTSNEKSAFIAFHLPARTGQSQITLYDLPKGAYAFVMFHDENGNNKLDSNLIGIPKEGYAYSNKAGQASAPTFSQAKFMIDSQQNILAPTKMIYWK